MIAVRTLPLCQLTCPGCGLTLVTCSEPSLRAAMADHDAYALWRSQGHLPKKYADG